MAKSQTSELKLKEWGEEGGGGGKEGLIKGGEAASVVSLSQAIQTSLIRDKGRYLLQ